MKIFEEFLNERWLERDDYLSYKRANRMAAAEHKYNQESPFVKKWMSALSRYRFVKNKSKTKIHSKMCMTLSIPFTVEDREFFITVFFRRSNPKRLIVQYEDGEYWQNDEYACFGITPIKTDKLTKEEIALFPDMETHPYNKETISPLLLPVLDEALGEFKLLLNDVKNHSKEDAVKNFIKKYIALSNKYADKLESDRKSWEDCLLERETTKTLSIDDLPKRGGGWSATKAIIDNLPRK